MKGFMKSAHKAGTSAEEEQAAAAAAAEAPASTSAAPAKQPAAQAAPAAPQGAPPAAVSTSDADDDDEQGGPETKGKMLQRHKRVGPAPSSAVELGQTVPCLLWALSVAQWLWHWGSAPPHMQRCACSDACSARKRLASACRSCWLKRRLHRRWARAKRCRQDARKRGHAPAAPDALRKLRVSRNASPQSPAKDAWRRVRGAAVSGSRDQHSLLLPCRTKPPSWRSR